MFALCFYHFVVLNSWMSLLGVYDLFLF